MQSDHIPVPSDHAPAKDMVTDAQGKEAIVWEQGKTVTGAWIKADASDLVGVEQ